MADQTLRDYLERRRAAMTTERSSFIPHYKELSQFIAPRRGRYFTSDRNRGEKRHNSIINSAATTAHRKAQSGLLAGMMSPARPWFALETPDRDMMEFGPVKNWLYKTEQIIRAIQNEGNFYNMTPVLLGELLQFGTGCMSHLDDFEDVARFYTHTAGSYMIAQNERCVVDTVIREFEWTVQQIVGEFGLENVSTRVKTAWDRSEYDQWIPIVHIVEPNPDADTRKRSSKYKRFRSIYYEVGNADKDKLLSQKGFDTFPMYCPRWAVTGEDVYGTDCPAMTALGDIKGLQIEEKRKAQAVDKLVNPPLAGPPSLQNKAVSSLPGGVTIYQADGNDGKLQPIYQVNPNLQELRADIQAVEQRINEAFYVDLFLAFTNIEGIQPRNEFDLMQRNEERLLQIGPVLERLQSELLGPIVDRLFDQASAAGILPPPPQELQGKPLRIKYISTLAMAQRAVATGSIDRVAAFAGGLFKAGWQNILDKFDADQALDEYANAIGAPPSIIVTDDVVAAKREQAQQQMQAAMALEAAEKAANTGKMMADAKTGEKNMLTDMAGTNG